MAERRYGAGTKKEPENKFPALSTGIWQSALPKTAVLFFFVFIVSVYSVPKTWRPILVVIGMLQIQRLVAVTGFQ